MTLETESGLPPQAEQAEQDATQVEQQASPDTTTEQTQEQQAEKREPWFQKRIGELTREKYEARRAAEEAQQRIAEYEQRLAQVQQGQQPDPKAPDVETLAAQKARELVAEQRFNEQCSKVYSTGKAEFPDFDQAVANLQMVGVNRDFLDLATSSDAGPKLLHHLGTDLDEAARILSLPPVQMARELTKLEIKLANPAPKPVSKAPAPISPIGTTRADDQGLRDDLPIDEWMRRNRTRK